MSKLYCTNCKYHKYDDYSGNYCNISNHNSLFRKTARNYKGEKEFHFVNKQLFARLFKCNLANRDSIRNSVVQCIPNHQFKCPLYKRKWYKFWIKEREGPKHLLVELMGETKNEEK